MIQVLFLCVGNSARSQMAEGFTRKLGKGLIEAYSAGSKPAVRVEPLAIEVMKEKNIDISNAKPKGFDDIPSDGLDYVISMGCEKVCPFVPAKKYIEWDIPDPKSTDINGFRLVRDIIELEVKDFIKSIGGK